MIKIRNKRIAMLLVLAMLVTMFASIGTASAASTAKGENGILMITKSVNTNIDEDVADNLGYVKIAIEGVDAVDGTVYVEMTLPDDVEFDDTDPLYQDDTQFVYEADSLADTDFLALLDATLVPAVIVDSSSADDINVDVVVTYVDTDNNEVDTFEGALLLAQKADQDTTVSAASPKSVSMGYDKKIAKITLDEAIAGSLEQDSIIVFELPKGFAWADVAGFGVTQGTYDLTASLYNGPDFDPDYDKEQLVVQIDTESTLADKFRFVGYVTVYPDAPDGDVVVEVYDDSTGGPDSNLSSTDLTVAVVGGAEVTVTAEDTSSTSDYIYRAQENGETWEITLETNASFASGDDLLLTLPDGVEFMEDIEATDFPGFRNNGLYDSNQGLWLTVETDTTSDLVIDGEDLLVGVKPDFKVGDLVLTLGGDVVDAEVVVQKVIDRVTVSAPKTNVKIGLDQVAGVVTLVENKKKAFADGDVIYIKTPNGVEFSSKPKVFVGEDREEVDVTKVADDTMSFELDELKTADVDTITIESLKFDIDSRFVAGAEIALSVGGINADNDDLNRLDGSDDAQFEAEADDVMFKVPVCTVGTVKATKVVFTIGANSYVKDGVTFSMDVAPFAQNGRTYVPVRFIANALNVPDQNIYWDQVNQTVTLIKDNNVVQFKLGSTTRLINAIPATMDVAPIAQNGRIFLPARFVAEAFEAVVGWDAAFPNQVLISIE